MAPLTRPSFLVMRVMDENYSANRFRIIEKVHTIDGIRDRITNLTFPTLEGAEQFIEEKENG